MQFVCQEQALPEILAWGEELSAIRHDIHRHPELGFETQRTVGAIVGYLKDWGVETIDTDFVKGAVIGIINGNRPGRTVALRADMDALPMTDCSESQWTSTFEGRAHACGHDGHVTWLLGAARYLASHRDFPGRVVLVFQPAEELGKGAKTLVEAGLLEKFEIAEIFGAHTEPLLPKGVFGFRVGPLQASADSFYLTLKGRGTHGGRPHLGIDPIPVGAQIVSALQTIVARKVDPIETAVISICSFNSGRYETMNVIPHELTMSGTVRTFSPDVRNQIEETMRKMVETIAEANGCQAEFTYKRLIAAVINKEEQTRAGIAAATALLGEDHVRADMAPMMSSEDFSEYLERVPGAIMRVGIRDEAHTVSLHHQAFDFNDEVLPIASSVIVRIALSRLNALA